MDRYTTEIVASEMQMLGGRSGDSGSSANFGGGTYSQPQQQVQSTGSNHAPDPEFDDDVPF